MVKSVKKNEKGFSAIELVIVLLFVGLIAFVGWKVLAAKNKDTGKKSNASTPTKSTNISDLDNDSGLIWQQTAKGWEARQKAPECADQPMLTSPVDLNTVTSVLYPGQKRGGNYKPHGGFRFDTTKDNMVAVTAPISGYIVRGAQYFAEGTTEIQYTFDIMNNCGIMYRVGHLRELPVNLKKIADSWPAPTASSATQSVNPAVFVKKGEALATKVGLISESNTFFDWGVYDYRNENQASKSVAYQNAHTQDKELSWHAVCWLKDWLPSSDESKLASLPAGDPTSGKISDYCN